GIGAHPGYPDLAGFGRRDLDLTPDELRSTLVVQIGAVVAAARVAGVDIRHVKPHGAMYNRAARDPATAATIAGAVHDLSPAFVLVGLAGSASVAAGREIGLRVAEEGFADRRYEGDGSLRSRRFDGALLAPAAGLGRPIPAHASVLVPFDPLVLDREAAVGFVRRAMETAPDGAGAEPDLARTASAPSAVEIPVRYGGDDGPDLDAVAGHCG